MSESVLIASLAPLLETNYVATSNLISGDLLQVDIPRKQVAKGKIVEHDLRKFEG